MYPYQGKKSYLVRIVVATLMGIFVALGNPFAIDAKEKISKRALQEMIAGAKTPADHQAIADYYYAEAAKARAQAVEHQEMAGWYRTAGEGTKKTPYAPGTIDHCERLVKDYRSTADDLTALAKEHEAMAAKGK
jgi:hypothetical protein